MLFATFIALPFFFAEKLGSALALAMLWSAFFASWGLMRRGLLMQASLTLVCGMWVGFAGVTLLSGATSSTNVTFLVALTVLTGLLLGPRWATGIALLTALFVLGMALAPNWTAIPQPLPAPPLARWISDVFALALALVPLSLGLHDLSQALKAAQAELEERRRAEAALILSEERFRAIFDSMRDAIFVHDIETGQIVDVNNETCRMFSCAREDIIGQTVNPLSLGEAPYTGVEAAEWMRKATAGLAQRFEWHSRGGDGRQFWVEVDLHRANINGKERLLAVVHDITERKHYEDMLKRLSAAVEQAAESVIITNPRLEVEYINPAGCSIIQWRMEEALGRQLQDLWEVDWAASDGAAAPDFPLAEPWTGRARWRRRDGKHRQADFSLAPIRGPQGAPTGYVLVGRDVTRDLQVEEQLRRSQKLEAIGNLAGGIAHDFNNLLFAILANAELMAEDIPEDSEARECLDQVLQASNRARELVQQILAFSRLSQPKMAPLNPASIVREVYKLLRATLPSTIELRLTLEPYEPLINADGGELHQVLVNLCTNASHAIGPRLGLIEIQLRTLLLDAESAALHPGLKPGPYVQLSVSDTGCGMPPEVRERIFEPFFTTKGEGQGTGMGLAVVHGVVARLGGAITVYSEPERGSSFHIYLPVLSGADAEPEDTALKLPRGVGRILVVDDEPAIRSALERLLGRLGYRVTACADGRHALELLGGSAEPFQLLITDQVMPRMTGSELARQAQALFPELPVIVCTGFSPQVAAELAMPPGIWGYLAKPVSTVELARAVARALDME